MLFSVYLKSSSDKPDLCTVIFCDRVTDIKSVVRTPSTIADDLFKPTLNSRDKFQELY